MIIPISQKPTHSVKRTKQYFAVKAPLIHSWNNEPYMCNQSMTRFPYRKMDGTGM